MVPNLRKVDVMIFTSIAARSRHQNIDVGFAPEDKCSARLTDRMVLAGFSLQDKLMWSLEGLSFPSPMRTWICRELICRSYNTVVMPLVAIWKAEFVEIIRAITWPRHQVVLSRNFVDGLPLPLPHALISLTLYLLTMLSTF